MTLVALADVVDRVLEIASRRPPLLGGGRMVCIDGPAGSGKTTLAGALAAAATGGVALVHADDVLQGWHGIPALDARLRNYLVGPLAAGHPSRMPVFNWVEDRSDGTLVVRRPDWLVLEGVGTGGRGTSSRRAALVWVDAPVDVRLARGLARDGEEMRPQWEQWLIDEATEFRRQRTATRADLLLSTDGAQGGYRLTDAPTVTAALHRSLSEPAGSRSAASPR